LSNLEGVGTTLQPFYPDYSPAKNLKFSFFV